MAVPMSTLVPLKKFAANAFAIPRLTSLPVKITKSATSCGNSCKMVPRTTLQPNAFPQPLKAAPRKKPSQRLWKKSPMTTAPTRRAVALSCWVLSTFTGLFGSASTLSLGCHHDDTAKGLYHRRKHQTCKDHGPPAPHHINFRAPSHCHQVSGFKEE
eukprot:Skav220433  [mRNA]  locus=scaffold639:882753:883415:- [translate_table: standard]